MFQVCFAFLHDVLKCVLCVSCWFSLVLCVCLYVCVFVCVRVVFVVVCLWACFFVGVV